MRRGYPTGGDHQRPAQDPPPRPWEGAALEAARPGAPGNLGLPDRAPRDQRPDRPSVRRRGPRSGLDLLRQGPAPDPPYRYRDGGHSPLRTGLSVSLGIWPRSPTCSSHRDANAPAHERSNEPGTTATRSKSPANPPAHAIPDRPRSTSQTKPPVSSMIDLGYVALRLGLVSVGAHAYTMLDQSKVHDSG